MSGLARLGKSGVLTNGIAVYERHQGLENPKLLDLSKTDFLSVALLTFWNGLFCSGGLPCAL